MSGHILVLAFSRIFSHTISYMYFHVNVIQYLFRWLYILSSGKSTDPIIISYQDRIGQVWDRTGIGTRKDLSEIKTVNYQLRSEQRNPEQRIPGESTGTLNNIISRPEQYIPDQITGQIHIISGPGQYIPEHRSQV